nr:hypothetical protein [Sphingomonas adhaesiva]
METIVVLDRRFDGFARTSNDLEVAGAGEGKSAVAPFSAASLTA